MVGYAPLDASIFGFTGLLQRKEHIAVRFIKSISSSLSQHPSVATRILEAYGITEAASDDDAFIKILQFASDVSFRAPAESFAKGFHGDSYLLELAEGNPWDGPFKGHSTHVLDVALLFQNYNEHLDEKQRQIAESFAVDVINFVHGQAPWKRFQDGAGRMVYENGTRMYKQAGVNSEKYESLLELGEEIGLDALLKVWQNFLFPQ
ncbi:uncharacterized protein ColSpa_08349 [Colletotrichum spaethianum]|uniref:Carboxylesterase type B domain-containing protein n=1 Tax=Colletotrichum spaethianum TaxID=700344 RepID=A0AA37URJ0_9PEZI|nr:uncharacterized protein ColSpa_08349 [Colletotrichum spaethianum]GKT48168.1 hypothetical protein ColSpa_08349 [Colletotrichum spaethianum]